MPSITAPYRNGFDYGVGVDTPSSDVRDVAVTGDKSEIPDAGGSIVTLDMRQVSTVSEMNDVLGISASASGGLGLFSASARFNFSKEQQINDSSVFLIVTVQVTNPFQQIKAPGITKDASDLLSNGQTQKFQDEFGDMFVRGLVTGGLFFGMIEVQTHDSDEKTKVSASLKASYGAFSADGSFDDNFHQTLKSRQTTVRRYSEGGQITPVPKQVDTMIDFATKWPDTVKKNAVPYSAVLDAYSILPLPAEPNFINTIAAAASNAVDHPKEAAMPQLKLTGPIELPMRKQAPLIEPGTLIRIPEVRGMETGAAEATLAQVGLHSQRVLIENGNNDSPPTGDVAIVEPSVGTLVPVGETIILTIEMNVMQ